MISIDTASIQKLEQQLEELIKTTERKLKNMVAGFSYNIAMHAISKTPLGSSADFPEWYARRTLLPNIEGIAQGNWQYSEGSAELILNAGQNAGDKALSMLMTDVKANYSLGDSFSIVNTAPYIRALEYNYSPQTEGQGIYKPTKDLVLATYKIDLNRYYQQG